MHRRDFLASAAAGLPLAAGAGQAADATPTDAVAFPGMIVRGWEPLNLEFPFGALDRFVLPTERFFVRRHFARPKIDPAVWKLRVDGHVERPFEISLDEIRKLPSETRPLTIECAGNGRVFLVPKAGGVAWQLGAVGNAEWTGVPLAALLERAGVKAGAEEVILQGADKGTIAEEPKTPGEIHFERSMPLRKARADTLLAYGMNGQDLPAEHGAPLRAVVPGWFGVMSVKWLTRITVINGKYHGYFQTLDYSYFERPSGHPNVTPLGQMQVKASIARPAIGDTVPAKSQHRIFGAAWTGEAEITKVEVSTDGGQGWREASLLDKPVKSAWRLWEYIWKTPDRPGRATLMAKATDSRGHTQPMQRNPDWRAYAINHVIPVEIDVR
jgi:DMSO/TMAO reductase YedYZ molybdopterin-dependent catalytic subunit